MIRLLLLALLVVNLQGKEDVLTIMIQIDNPKESQDTQEFFKAFKALYDYMYKSVGEIEPTDPEERMSRLDRISAIEDYTDASIPLAKAVAKQIPLLHEFKPKNKREELFLAHLKDMEMLHVLDVIDYPNGNYEPKATAHTFLDVIALLYMPLINAHKAGLDAIAYLKQLHKGISQKQCNDRDINNIIHICTDNILAFNLDAIGKNIDPHQPFRKRLIQDMDHIETLMGIFSLDWGIWAGIVINTILKSKIPPTFIFENDFYEFVSNNIQRLDPEHLSDLYAARMIPLENNAPFYNRLQNDNPKILKDTLKDHPTMCLSPKYLSPKSKQTCLQLFQTQTYNAKDIQEQLHLVRLISIDDSPCVYLDPKDKIQTFKSKNALCLALQEHLTKEQK
ncbi:tRNA methyltransferase [Helicobacter mehlei]|uniref:tRNA methyltransferase n=1 Tax=Helicobacter mehlei TaxID=2316080 RepID=UPI001F250CA2|nr:tRNA methyltransferase [Helicobacter mehlei]